MQGAVLAGFGGDVGIERALALKQKASRSRDGIVNTVPADGGGPLTPVRNVCCE